MIGKTSFFCKIQHPGGPCPSRGQQRISHLGYGSFAAPSTVRRARQNDRKGNASVAEHIVHHGKQPVIGTPPHPPRIARHLPPRGKAFHHPRITGTGNSSPTAQSGICVRLGGSAQEGNPLYLQRDFQHGGKHDGH